MEASQYPNRPITIVLGAPPPRSGDTLSNNLFLADLLTRRLSEPLDQKIVVHYVSNDWVAGLAAPAYVAQSDPDGYTLLLDYHVPPINAAVGKLRLEDIVPVAQLASRRWVFASHPSVPANTLQEFIDHTRRVPGTVTFTSYHVAAHGHLIVEELKRKTGADLTHTPATTIASTSPSAAAANALVTGAALFGTIALDQALPLIGAGKVKPLAVTGQGRSPLAPEIPTVTEAGVPDANISIWSGVWAPAGTPKSVIDTLNRAIVQVMGDPQTEAGLLARHLEVTTGSAEEFQAVIEKDFARWKELVAYADIRPEDM